MDFLADEEEVIARLKDQLGNDVKVEAWPNDPGAYDFASAGGAVLVRYEGSDYALPVPNEENTLLQDETGKLAVVVLNRSLRAQGGQGGAYELIKAVIKALRGFTVGAVANPERTPLYPANTRYLSRDAGKWAYQITFAQVSPEAET